MAVELDWKSGVKNAWRRKRWLMAVAGHCYCLYLVHFALGCKIEKPRTKSG